MFYSSFNILNMFRLVLSSNSIEEFEAIFENKRNLAITHNVIDRMMQSQLIQTHTFVPPQIILSQHIDVTINELFLRTKEKTMKEFVYMMRKQCFEYDYLTRFTDGDYYNALDKLNPRMISLRKYKKGVELIKKYV